MTTSEGETSKEEIKKLVEAKARIERRIQGFEKELEHLKSILKVLDSAISEKSFMRIETSTRPATVTAAPKIPLTPPSKVYGQVVPLKTATGTLLANMHIEENEIRVAPDEAIKFNVNTPPFQQFLVSKILEQMQIRDKEASKAGAIEPDKAFSYTILKDGDVLKEIIIKNYRDPKRLQEIKASLRWTFDKMYEKTQKAGS